MSKQDNPSHPSPDPELMLATLMFLMTQYAADQDERLVLAIRSHLAHLKSFPSGLSPMLQKNLAQIQQKWDRLDLTRTTFLMSADATLQ